MNKEERDELVSLSLLPIGMGLMGVLAVLVFAAVIPFLP